MSCNKYSQKSVCVQSAFIIRYYTHTRAIKTPSIDFPVHCYNCFHNHLEAIAKHDNFHCQSLDMASEAKDLPTDVGC